MQSIAECLLESQDKSIKIHYALAKLRVEKKWALFLRHSDTIY